MIRVLICKLHFLFGNFLFNRFFLKNINEEIIFILRRMNFEICFFLFFCLKWLVFVEILFREHWHFWNWRHLSGIEILFMNWCWYLQHKSLGIDFLDFFDFVSSFQLQTFPTFSPNFKHKFNSKGTKNIPEENQ